MPASRILPILLAVLAVAVGGFVYFGPMGPGSLYHRFHGRDPVYYSRLAHACDSVLQQHPDFTKHSESATNQQPATMLWMDTDNVLWEQVRLSPKDASLPEPVRALHPDEVLLSPKRVCICFGVGRAGWSITWEQDDMQTNLWIMQSNAEGLLKRVYAETR